MREAVLGHELVHGELMIGDAGSRAKLLSEYIKYTYVAPVPHRDVVELVRARRLYAKRLG